MIEGHRGRKLRLAVLAAFVLLTSLACSVSSVRLQRTLPTGFNPARSDPDRPRSEPSRRPARGLAAAPRPTEVAEEGDEEELNRGRREWFESLHRAAPGTDWRAIEAATWQRHLAARNARRRDALNSALIPDAPPWVEVGSSNLAGRTHQVALHAATNSLYLGSDRGGLWRGDFDPASPAPDSMGWTPLSDGVFGGAFQVVVLDGPPLTLLKTYAQDYSSEIHRSGDGGATWTLATGVTGRVRRLLSLENAEETVFAITDEPNHWACGAGTTTTTKLLRSRDRGATFWPVRDLGGSRADIWTARNALGPLYLLTDNRLEVSYDRGATWAIVGVLPWVGPSRVSLTASEAGGPAFYALMHTNDCSGSWTMFASFDGGVTWTSKGTVDDFWSDMVSLTASTTDPSLVLYGGTELWRSTDGAASFTKVNEWFDYYGDPDRKLHADIPWVGFVPTPIGEVLFVSTDGGTYYSLDGGATVKNVSLRGLNVGQYYSTLSDEGDPRRLHAGSQDQGYQTGEAGRSEAFQQVVSGDYGHLTSSSGGLSLVYSVYPGFLLVAESGGIGPALYTADFPLDDHHWLPCIVADPLDPAAVYLCARHLHRFVRSGDSWLPTQLPFDFGGGIGDYVSAFAIAPSNPSRWYAATVQGRLWYSTDAGLSWRQSTFSSVPDPQYLTGVAMVVNPSNAKEVFVGGSGYSNPAVYRSLDGGHTFAPFSTGLPSTLVIGLTTDPLGGADLYAATESGPYRYDSVAGAWQSLLGDAAPLTTYWSVESVFDRVRFGTYGRGIWDYVPSQPGCAFSISPSVATFSDVGGNGVLDVVTGVGCRWSASRMDDWIGFAGAAEGAGTGAVPFHVAPNVGPDRIGHLTVAGRTLTIAQGNAALPSVSIGTVAVDEGDPGGTTLAVFTVALSEVVTYPVKVSYATLDGTATAAGGDYVAVSGALTIPPGDLGGTVIVSVNGDDAVEADETFFVRLADPVNATIASLQGTGTILNDDMPPSLSIRDAASTEGDRGTSLLSFVVSLSRPSDVPVSVRYETQDGTAIGGSDYTPAAGAVTIPAGRLSTTVGVMVKGDLLMEPDETVLVNLSQPTHAGIESAQATGTILNDDRPGYFAFSLAKSGAREAAGLATVTVVRGNGRGAGATVDYETIDGSAQGAAGPTQDYTPTTGTLTFGGNVTSAAFTVPIAKDTRAEGEETVLLRLRNPQPAALGATLGLSLSVLTIADDDSGGGIRFSSAAYTVSEGAGQVTLTVRRTGGHAGDVAVHYASSPDSASGGGTDYSDVEGDVTFASSGAGAATQTITIPIIQDSLAEGAETFSVSLSAPTGGGLLSTPTVATVSIVDDEATVEFAADTYSAKETQASALISVRRSGPPSGVVTVDYSAGGGSATEGVDYRAVAGRLTFPNGVSTRTLLLPLTNDTLVEGPETVGLALSNPGGIALGRRSKATLTIVDDDVAQKVSFGAATYRVGEAAARATIIVKRTGSLSHVVTVDYLVTGGTATNGADYDLPERGTLTFGKGITTQAILMPLKNDFSREGTETVDLALQGPQDLDDPGQAVLGAQRTTELEITDDESTIQFATATYAASEGAGSVAVGLKRTGNLTAPATVEYDVTGGTATRGPASGGDYTLPAHGTLTFAPGRASTTLPIALTQDAVSERSETIELALTGPTWASFGTPSRAVVTILDDDRAGSAQFSDAAYAVREFTGAIAITVTRSGGSCDLATVHYSTSDGTAIAGSHYVATSGTLTFRANETSKSFGVSLTDDGIADGGALFLKLTLDTPGGGLTLGPVSTTTLWIVRE